MPENNKPNLFEFATSELSQDAFICWLISWAKPHNAGEDNDLHQCAINLLNALFDKCGKEKPSIYKEIEVLPQRGNIDVLVKINGNEYAIIIEDKIVVKNHSGQLERYLKYVKEGMKFSEDKILPIYFKTGDQCSYKEIEENGYKRFSRSDFLKVLYNGITLGVKNEIFLDYRDRLKRIEDGVNSYKVLPKGEWWWESWTGFFIELQGILSQDDPEAGWDYVPNKTGGFMGFWWKFHKKNSCTHYLQLECYEESEDSKPSKLTFKIGVEEESSNRRRELRDDWSQRIVEQGAESGLKFKRPDRFGNGRSMTVAELDGDFRRFNNDGKANMENTIAEIEKVEQFLISLK